MKAASIALLLCTGVAGAQDCIDSRGSLWPCEGDARPVLKMRYQLHTEEPARTWKVEDDDDGSVTQLAGDWLDAGDGALIYVATNGSVCGGVAHGVDAYLATYISAGEKHAGDVMHFREMTDAFKWVEAHCQREPAK